MSLAAAILAGDRLSLARLLTRIENQDPQGLQTLGELFPHTGRAAVIGITGAPGTGKSTLVNQLALALRRGLPALEDAPAIAPRTVGIVAVDPSSPFTGGAFLGDRIRMRDLAGDPGVFIRSMASRGALGGVARATADLVQALDAAGWQVILIETVGAGQAEVEIARTAHSTIVVEVPGLGDDVQAVKAGILEIADILVVNKADLPGAENTLRALRAALALGPAAARPGAAVDGWEVPVLPASSVSGEGIPELLRMLEDHRGHLIASGELQQRQAQRLKAEMLNLLRDSLQQRFLASQQDAEFERLLEKVIQRQLAPRQAIERLLAVEER